MVLIDVRAGNTALQNNSGGGDDEEVIEVEPLPEIIPQEEPEPMTAEETPAPTVQFLVTPEVELGDLDLSTPDEPVDLSLLVGGEIDPNTAEILIKDTQNLYTKAINSVGGHELGSFEIASLDPASLAQALDSLRRGLDGFASADDIDGAFVLQVSTGLGAVLSVSFVSWILRGGALAATLLSTIPMWKGFDPLPMLLGRRRAGDEEDKREDMSEAGDSSPTSRLREMHLERMFSTSGRFASDELTERKSK